MNKLEVLNRNLKAIREQSEKNKPMKFSFDGKDYWTTQEDFRGDYCNLLLKSGWFELLFESPC